MGVLAVAEVVDLLEDDGEPVREGRVRDLVQVGGDLRVVRGDDPERVGGELRPELRAHGVVAPELGDELRVVLRAADGRDPGAVAGGRAEERRPADVDHLDRLVEADELGADRRGERGDVDDDDVDRPDALARQLGHLGLDVAPGEDARVDRRVEGLDLAADQGRHPGQVRDGADVDAVGGEVVAGAVGGEDLDLEGQQVPGQSRDPLAVGDRQQGSHPGCPSSDAAGRGLDALVLRPRITRVMAYSDTGAGPVRTRRATGRAEARRTAPTTARIERAAGALGLPVHPLHGAHVPGHLHAALGVVARPARRPDRPLQRPDAGPPPPRRLPRHVGVAALDRASRCSGCCSSRPASTST